MSLIKSSRRPGRTTFPAFGTSTAFPSLQDFENRMNRFMERAVNDPFGLALTEPIGWVPAMDIVETAKELMVTAELPGMDRKDIDVSIDNGVLTISGEKNDEREHEDRKAYLYERSYGSFQRAFSLPANVDEDKIAAEFEKGVLKIHLPKDGASTPKGRKVEIKTA